MKTRILTTMPLLAALLFLQACTAQQLANLSSCSQIGDPNCGRGLAAGMDMAERERLYRADLAAWEACKAEELGGSSVYCGGRPIQPTW